MSDGLRPLRMRADGRLADTALFGPDLLGVIGMLADAGEQARIVGGAVRNTLLGLPVSDLDVATTAPPRMTMRLARSAGMKALPTGLAHGTVTVLAGSSTFEVTTLREDIETDGRHAVVRFSRDFAADAGRRDFTINALSAGADAIVHDTTGGIADLAAGRVRFIGAADSRIQEDYLRLLRFFRFHACYAVGPADPEGLAAAIRHRDALARLSKERVRGEWFKLLVAPHAVSTVRTAVAAGIAERVLSVPSRPERLARLVAGEGRRGQAADGLLRLAALAVDTVADVTVLRENLRLSNDERDRLLGALAVRDRLGGPPGAQALREALYGFGVRAVRDGLLLAAAGGADAREAWDACLALLPDLSVPELPIGGVDVLARGVSGGRRVGAVLKHLQAAWIRAGFPQDPTRLARLLDDAIEAEKHP